ncbi:MAG: endolytic transglycosylase MltG [Steroidobacteraceae bacterium]
MSRRARIVVGVALMLAVALATAAGLYWQSLQIAARTPGASLVTQDLHIEPGMPLRAVLRELERRELITDARRLEYFLRCCQSGARIDGAGIKAGHYRIAPGQTPLDILRQLVEGRVVLEQITLVDGWRFAQARTLVERHPAIVATLAGRSDAEVMQALGQPGLAAEGRFAPDTYSFAPGTTDLTLYRMAFEAQQRQLAKAWEQRQPDLPLTTPDEALTLASIVEKETGLASERPRIAGVFVNRLRRGMKLQSDPTVIYGLGENYDGNIRRRDLTTDTPYNTYTRAGLPPTPIALPGRDAIIATLNPEHTDAIFFVAIGDGSGGHYFSATLGEHNRAVQRLLQRLRQKPPQEEPEAPPALQTPSAPPASAVEEGAAP